jgi:chorismate mutase
MIKSIRGATTADSNTAEDIRKASKELIEKILEKNHLKSTDIINIVISCTKDLDAAYPAKFLREIEGFDAVPMLCVQEMHVEGSLSKCIRFLLTVQSDKEVRHIYLKEAIDLRVDIQC